MRFVFPTLAYKEKAIDFINEFYLYNSEINGSGSLHRFLSESSYEEWVKKVISDIDIANVPEDKVPELTYFYVNDNGKIVGMINIRLQLNDFLRTEGGHIGYSVRPTERGKHYATDMLHDALKFCRRIGLNEIIITCDKSNTASAKVITNNGGTIDAEFYSKAFDEIIQRYIIK